MQKIKKNEHIMGLSDLEYEYLMKNVVAPLVSQGFSVYIFGSRAKGEYQKYSDVDLLVRGGGINSLNLALLEIKETLEEGCFPYKVDLVIESELAESFKKQVLEEMIELS